MLGTSEKVSQEPNVAVSDVMCYVLFANHFHFAIKPTCRYIESLVIFRKIF